MCWAWAGAVAIIPLATMRPAASTNAIGSREIILLSSAVGPRRVEPASGDVRTCGAGWRERCGSELAGIAPPGAAVVLSGGRVRLGWRATEVVGGRGVSSRARSARYGGKLFGFLQFFISLCAITLCGQNGSGRAGRLWYTRSPAKHSAVKLRGCERRARRGTMPCIVIVKPVDSYCRTHGFDLRCADGRRGEPAAPSIWQAKACADRAVRFSRQRSLTIRSVASGCGPCTLD
jgi:hypothetical protein